MRDSLVIYRSFYEASKNMTPEEFKELWVNLLQYALDDEEPGDIQSPMAEAILTMAKPQLDANKSRQDNGKKGGAPEGNQNAKKQPKQPKVDLKNNLRSNEKQPHVNVNDNENVNANDNEKHIHEAPAKPKHALGEHKNVKLTEEEKARLDKDYGQEKTQAAIDFLSDYKKRKGYKSLDDNLTIRKWVIAAVEEEEEKRRKRAGPAYKQFEARDYDFDELEKAIIANGG